MRLLPLALLVCLALTAPAGAASAYRVGMSDQQVGMFSNPHFEALELKRVRYLFPWDGLKYPSQIAETDGYMAAARAGGYEVFLTFTASRGCWTGTRYLKSSKCKAPSSSRFKSAVRAFRKRYPWIKVFAPWNEVNHKSQPTYRSAKKAASYYNVMRSVCRGCKLVAADVLDSSSMVRYLRTFRRYAKGSPRRWGVHNYADVNRKRSRGTVAALRYLPGEVWLTETGGIVRFKGFPYSESRAASRTRYMFSLADRYDTRRRGMKSKITRIYVYQWTGAPRGTRWDAGMVDPNGTPRANYRTFRSLVRSRRK